MFKWLKRKLPKACSVKIRVEETTVFVGEVESFDVYTNVEGSNTYVTIRFQASELIKKLKVS